MKNIIYSIFILSALFLGCKKEGSIGPEGPQGEQGPPANEYEFYLVFGPGTGNNIQYYDMPDLSMYGKSTFVFIEYSYDYDWVQLPYLLPQSGNNSIMLTPITDELLERVTIETYYVNGGTANPWGSNITLRCKAVCIETRFVESHPEIDFTKYENIKSFIKK